MWVRRPGSWQVTENTRLNSVVHGGSKSLAFSSIPAGAEENPGSSDRKRQRRRRGRVSAHQRACRRGTRAPCSQHPAEARSPVFLYGGRARKEMGEFQQYFDIILFAMVAGFLVLRLRSVLGRRTGNERRRELFVRRQRAAPEKGPTLVEPSPGAAATTTTAPPADAVAEGLNQIRRADP